MTRTGLRFERHAILTWLQEHDTCPLSRQPLNVHDILPDKALQVRIENWRRHNGIPLPVDREDTIFHCVVELSKEEGFALEQRFLSSEFQSQQDPLQQQQQQQRRRRRREQERSTKQRFKFLTKMLTTAEQFRAVNRG